jgi:hypothetical protein
MAAAPRVLVEDSRSGDCSVLGEGRDQPVCDLRTYGKPRNEAALAAAVEACLAELTAVIREEMRWISG